MLKQRHQTCFLNKTAAFGLQVKDDVKYVKCEKSARSSKTKKQNPKCTCANAPVHFVTLNKGEERNHKTI